MNHRDPRLSLAHAAVFGLLWAAAAGAQAPTVPAGYGLSLVADSLPAPTYAIAAAPASFGRYAGELFLAAGDRQQVIRVSPRGSIHVFAESVAVQPINLSFAPGGAFGTDLFVSCNQDPGALDYGIIWRLDSSGSRHYFGTQTPPAPLNYRFGAGGIAFSSAGAFGMKLYSGCSGGNLGDCLSRVDPAGGQAQLFSLLTGTSGGLSSGTPFGMQFGPGGDFGSNLYAAYDRTASGTGLSGGIYRFDASGARSAFAAIEHPGEIEFGPGGAFGADLYVADRNGAIVRIDASGNVTPFVSGIAGQAFGLAFADTSALYFNAVDNGGRGQLYCVFPAALAAAPPASSGGALTLSTWPNPFVDHVSIEWTSIREAWSRLAIYSVDGRKVRVVTNETLYPGRHRAVWDGRDDRGRLVGAGVYFATLMSGEEHCLQRVGLIR